MNHPAFVRRVLALVLTAAVAVAAALPGFAVYAMPIQTTYPQESIYLFDADTGEALVEQNPDMVRHVASLTKMMTALLVIENGSDLNASITIPDRLTPEFQSIKANRGHTIGLQAGESVRRIDMLYAMLLPSANDAASVLASDAAGGDLAAFAARMNARASQLGCTTTHFSCPHGLYDANNYSTARDLAKIALACYANPTYRQVADTVLYQLPATNVHEARTITTTNKLLQPGSAAYRSYAHGMKTAIGSRNLPITHQQMIETLATALVMQGNTIITSGGSSGTNAAAIRGAMKANPDKLSVVLPQTIGQQPSDVQDQLIGVPNIIEHADRAMMTLADASRICNREIIDECNQLICFLSHTSKTLHNAVQYAEEGHKVITVFYLD